MTYEPVKAAAQRIPKQPDPLEHGEEMYASLGYRESSAFERSGELGPELCCADAKSRRQFETSLIL